MTLNQLALQLAMLQLLIPHPAAALANGPHTRPQAPQFCRSNTRLASQPLGSILSQLPKPASHGPMTHWAPTHNGLEFCAATQRELHEPQLSASVFVFTSQPSPAIMLQSASGRTQSPTPHTPAMQVGPPPAGTGQLFPHRPQCASDD